MEMKRPRRHLPVILYNETLHKYSTSHNRFMKYVLSFKQLKEHVV